MDFIGLNSILEEFDFTDSIIIEFKVSKNFINLDMLVDYYWDIQEGRKQGRIFKISFCGCTKVNIQISNETAKNTKSSGALHSNFTIIDFKGEINNNLNEISIFTENYNEPFVKIVCNKISLKIL